MELLFPIDDEDIFNNIKNLLNLYLKDNVKASVLNKNGTYKKVEIRGRKEINTQQDFYLDAVNAVQAITNDKDRIKDLI